MSTVTIRETFRNSNTGALIDVDSVVLSDSTGAYGVRRTDTLATVVAANAVMVWVSTGVYEYTFTEPALGLTYTAWIKWTYAGNTYYTERTIVGTAISTTTSDLTPVRPMDKYITWIRNEFLPLTLATPDTTIEQCVDNAIRYWNTHSGYKITTMFDVTTTGALRVQLNPQFKSVIEVLPCQKTTWIWNDHPIWTLLGVTVIDNVTSDLILLSEAFRNYRIYVGADFRWEYVKSEDPAVGGYLYFINLPAGVDRMAVVGTKRVTIEEDIKQEYILDTILRWTKALVKQAEGNTLRKSSIIDIKNDGQAMMDEGVKEIEDLKKEIELNGRWCAFIKRG